MSYYDKRFQIDQLQQKIDGYGMLNDEIKKKINYKFRLDWNYYSNSMEGNTLTMDETRSVMVGNLTVGGKPIKDVLEIKGHDEVVSDIIRIGKGEIRLSESRIREIHKGIMHEEDPEKKIEIGVWKKHANYIYNYKGEKFEFVAPAEVAERIHRLLNKTNAGIDAIQNKQKDAPHPIDLALQFHLEYVLIHPFYDGNGRTARILTNLLLISFGYPPFWVKTEERNIYNQYIGDIQGYGGEPDLFFECASDMILRSQQLILDAIEGKNIEEKDDWEKQVSLLKKELSDKEEVKLKKSLNSVMGVFENSVFPLIEKLTKKLSTFQDLFSERRLLFGTMTTQRIIKDISIAKKLIVENQNDYLNEMKFTYSLVGFKRDGTNTFSVEVFVAWRFDDFKYYFLLNDSSYNTGIEKLYHQQFTQEEIDNYVSECGKFILKQIEERRKSK